MGAKDSVVLSDANCLDHQLGKNYKFMIRNKLCFLSITNASDCNHNIVYNSDNGSDHYESSSFSSSSECSWFLGSSPVGDNDL